MKAISSLTIFCAVVLLAGCGIETPDKAKRQTATYGGSTASTVSCGSVSSCRADCDDLCQIDVSVVPEPCGPVRRACYARQIAQ